MAPFLLKLFIYFLATPLIASLYVVARNGQLSDENKLNPSGAREDLVTNLPGQPDVQFRHYAGYVTVNENKGRELFYWFYEALNHPNEKPLVLWLNGGPGCSSVGYGATQEIGPFLVASDGKSLKANPYSWNREANMLFLESPVGVGFSYSDTTTDYDVLGDDFAANDAYAFLHKWFVKFPSYRNRVFYLAGESYAGRYVPELAGLIESKNKDPSLFINLRGILLGNPETSDAEDWRGNVDYAWSHAVISDEVHKTIKESCDFSDDTKWKSNVVCCQGVDELLYQYDQIDMYALYAPKCTHDSSKSENRSLKSMFNSTLKMMMPVMGGGGYIPCINDYAVSYYNRPDVQKALHVDVAVGHQLHNWSLCNMDIYYGWKQRKPTVLPLYKKLIDAGLRIWIYSGDTDGRVSVLSTRYSLSALGLPITEAWRPWYHQNQVSGWVQEYKGLTFATFRGAGHAVPLFKPSESLAFFSCFLMGQSPPIKKLA